MMTSRNVGGEFLRDDLRCGRADYAANPAVDPAAFGHWALRDKAVQRRSPLRWAPQNEHPRTSELP